jgi:hypothetical protein
MTLGSYEMIASFLCLVLCSRQTVMFAIRPLVQEIPNVHDDFRTPRKWIKGANANNIGKLS